eukprot:6187232-Pleurochrysis_carterae.AAC.2
MAIMEAEAEHLRREMREIQAGHQALLTSIDSLNWQLAAARQERKHRSQERKHRSQERKHRSQHLELKPNANWLSRRRARRAFSHRHESDRRYDPARQASLFGCSTALEFQSTTDFAVLQKRH